MTSRGTSSNPYLMRTTFQVLCLRKMLLVRMDVKMSMSNSSMNLRKALKSSSLSHGTSQTCLKICTTKIMMMSVDLLAMSRQIRHRHHVQSVEAGQSHINTVKHARKILDTATIVYYQSASFCTGRDERGGN